MKLRHPKRQITQVEIFDLYRYLSLYFILLFLLKFIIFSAPLDEISDLEEGLIPSCSPVERKESENEGRDI